MNLRSRLIIDELARHRVQFEALVRSLTPEELAAPIPGSHWSVRDYVVHLCTIDSLIAAGFSPMVGLSAPDPVADRGEKFDIDDWNDASVATMEGASIDQILAEGEKHRVNMSAAIAEMTDAHLDMVIPYGGDRKSLNLAPTPVRFGGLLWGIAIHDPTHTQDIVRAIPHRAEEPAVKEWLASVNDSLIPAGVREHRV